ncbi:hypothetical protein V495_03586, partial [Pseudogymnoascus sp. VKM F-4514 (FW-929)]
RVLPPRLARAENPNGEDVQPVQRNGDEGGEVRVQGVAGDRLAAHGLQLGAEVGVDVINLPCDGRWLPSSSRKGPDHQTSGRAFTDPPKYGSNGALRKGSSTFKEKKRNSLRYCNYHGTVVHHQRPLSNPFSSAVHIVRSRRMAKPTLNTVPRPSPPPPKTTYLILYNGVLACLRAWIVIRTLQLWSSHGNSKVWEELHNLVLWTETLTMIEVIHAQTGLVRASPATTALQVAGRNTIVWAITRNYPDVAAGQWAYSSMLVAWNVADSVRYTFFAIERGTGRVPNALLWLRYNMFFVLYPIGIVSEAWLAYSVITPSRSRNPAYQYLLWLGLTIYIPAFYILFGHMLAQRRKSLQKSAGKTA